MIFKNSIKLIVSNFSNVWKLLVYYLICFLVTALTCGFVLAPIVQKLVEADVFVSLANIFSDFFTTNPTDLATRLADVNSTILEVLTANVQFRFRYVFLFFWLFIVFPFLINWASLAMGDVLYGYMTSHVKYGFTGRFIKNIGKSALYSILFTLIALVLNSAMFGFICLIIKVATMGNVWFLVLDAFIVALFLVFYAFKHTLFCCWMPDIAVLDENVFKAFVHNFKSLPGKFANIFSNVLLMSVLAWVINLLFAVLTMGVSLIITLPLTAFTIVVVQMVSYFSTQGMRYYVYPDMFVSPKTFEEQDGISKLKYLL